MPAYYSPDNGSFKQPEGKTKLKWRCAKCGNINTLEVKFCARCHTRLGDEDIKEGEKVG